MSSLAYKLALVAAGRFDGLISLRASHDWDLAAAALLIGEAGGRISGADGAPLAAQPADAAPRRPRRRRDHRAAPGAGQRPPARRLRLAGGGAWSQRRARVAARPGRPRRTAAGDRAGAVDVCCFCCNSWQRKLQRQLAGGSRNIAVASLLACVKRRRGTPHADVPEASCQEGSMRAACRIPNS